MMSRKRKLFCEYEHDFVRDFLRSSNRPLMSDRVEVRFLGGGTGPNSRQTSRYRCGGSGSGSCATERGSSIKFSDCGSSSSANNASANSRSSSSVRPISGALYFTFEFERGGTRKNILQRELFSAAIVVGYHPLFNRVPPSVLDTTILEAIDKRKLTAVVYLDMSKAFESIIHGI